MSNVENFNEGGDQGLSRTSQQSTFSKITGKVSDGLEQVAGFIDEKVQGIKGEQESSKLASVGHRTVDALHSSASYLRTADGDQMKNDLRETIKRNPERSLLVGLGIGILLGSIFRKKG
jgi:hypothetical protein